MIRTYRALSEEEKVSGPKLIGSKIAIFWDGDDLFYPGTVTAFREETNTHLVKYDTGENDEVYEESTRDSVWLIEDTEASEIQFPSDYKIDSTGKNESSEDKVESAADKKQKKPSGPKASYLSMVVDAVASLDDKFGSSLVAIRKYILSNYDINKQHTASFNNLTLKAVNKAVATGELEKMKSHFKLTMQEKNRRKEKLRKSVLGPAYAASKAKGGGLSAAMIGSDEMSLFAGTYAYQSNKALRYQVIEARKKRDQYFVERYEILKPFLPEKNYFTSKNLVQEASSGTPVTMNSSAPLPVLSSFEATVNTESSDCGSKSVKPERANDNPTNTALDVKDDNDDNVDDELKATIILSNVHLAMKEVTILDQPNSLKAKLHAHQIQGISWMIHMFRNGMPMILGDQMGLGKTIQSIGFLAYLHEKMNQRGPHLVVVPLSVLSNWMSEIERFCPSFRAIRFHGPRDERNRIKTEELADLADFDIVVTTFEMVVSESNFFRRHFVWTSLIVDEGHRLKNEKSQLSEKLRVVPALSKIILTGTPLQNNLKELWALFHFLSPDIFSLNSAQYFESGFDLPKGILDTQVLRKARRLLSVMMLRRIKDQVNLSLPSRREITVLVPLTQQQIFWYKNLLHGLDQDTIETVMKETENNMNVNDHSDGNKEASAVYDNQLTDDVLTKSNSGGAADSDWRKLMNLIIQLRKVCNHIYLMPHDEAEVEEVGEHIVQGSGKLLMLDRMLPRLREDGHRVLIFSQFTSMLDILEDYCELRSWPYVRLDGETNRVRRRLDVRRYNAPGSSLFIFLISTRAGGLGLNLASADTVILYDSDWNPQVDLQAMERAHRIGQTKPVRVFRLICRGSVEERMVMRAEKKLFLNAMVAEADPDEMIQEENEDAPPTQGISGTAMTKSELASLIRFGANAVFEGEEQISDEHLDKLLERQGRDCLYVEPSKDLLKVGEDDKKIDFEEDEISKLQKDMLKRLDNLKEVDLRQLEGVLYSKKRSRGLNTTDENLNYVTGQLDIQASDIIDTKRARKQRIVMVDGKGTGYGGSVPVLAETIAVEPNHELTLASTRFRVRSWTHQSFCALCGKSKNREQMIRCAHCPRGFHSYCLEDRNQTGTGSIGSFICPHHRCVLCGRNTGSAGGMLFRCTGCLVAFCEDCLPVDDVDVEGHGRCRALEAQGYDSKQSYYIKCQSCCRIEGVTPSGIDGDSSKAKQERTIGKSKTDHVHDNGIKEQNTFKDAKQTSLLGDERENPDDELVDSVDDNNDTILFTEHLRVFWEEQPDSEEERRKLEEEKRKQKREKAKKKKQDRENSLKGNKYDRKKTTKPTNEFYDDADSDDDEMIDLPKKKKKQDVLLPLTTSEALDLLFENSKFVKLFDKCFEESQLNKRSDDWTAAILSARMKVESGRYRNVNAFINDVQFALKKAITDLNKKLKSLRSSPGKNDSDIKKASTKSNIPTDDNISELDTDELDRILIYFEEEVKPRLLVKM